jgi:general nucleoside transport system permease protein
VLTIAAMFFLKDRGAAASTASQQSAR